MFSYVFMKLLEGRPETYDRRVERVAGGHIRAVKEQIANLVHPGDQVLEIGCGTGELAVMMARRGAKVTAFDASEQMVRAARTRMVREKLEDRVTLEPLEVSGMDRLESATYDVVVSTLVLSELSPDEQRYAIKHAARVLRAGGHIAFADEVRPRTTWQRLRYQAVRFPMLAVTYLVSRSSTRPLEDLSGQLSNAGLEVTREERSLGDAFALVVACKPQEGGKR